MAQLSPTLRDQWPCLVAQPAGLVAQAAAPAAQAAAPAAQAAAPAAQAARSLRTQRSIAPVPPRGHSHLPPPVFRAQAASQLFVGPASPIAPVFRAPHVTTLCRGGVSDPPVVRAPRVPVFLFLRHPGVRGRDPAP